MLTLVLALALAQSQPAVRRSTPLADDPGMVVRQTGTLNINCLSGCSNVIYSPDGGSIGSVTQGTRPWLVAGTDGGPVQIEGSISATNPSVGTTGAATPTSATLIGGTNGTNLLAPYVITTTPDAGDPGLVVRVVGGISGGGSGGTVTQGTVPWLIAGVDAGAVPVQGTVTADTELPAAVTLTDALANPTAPAVGSYLLGWEGGATTWNRIRSSPTNADGEASHGQGALDTMAHNFFYNGTAWDRFRGTVAGGLLVDVSDNFLLDSTFTARFLAAAAAADNTANPSTTGVLGFNMLWDGATWDRAPGNSVDGQLVNLGANNDVVASQSGTWTVRNQDGAGNALASSTSAPTGTEQALIVRNIPSGTQTVSGTVTASVGGTVAGLVTREVLKTATNVVGTSVTCATSATAVPATPLTNRHSVCIYNNGVNTVFIGPVGVTTANGFPLLAGSSYCDDVNTTQVYSCIVAAGTENVRVLEN